MSENLDQHLKQSYLVTTGHAQLNPKSNERGLQEILNLANPTDKIVFNPGDFIKDFPAFNDFLEASFQSKGAISLTKDQARNLINNISRQLGAHGIDHLAMRCLGKDCMKFHTCAIALSGVPTPDGQKCPIEVSEIQQHLKGFAHDFEDLPSYADKVMVHNVVSCELIKGRILADMSNSPDVTVQVAKGVDRKGMVVYETVENPNQKSLQNINRVQERLLKALNMTLEQRKREQGNKKKKTDSDIMALYQQRLREFASKRGVAPIIDAETKPSKDQLTNLEESSPDGTNKEIHRKPNATSIDDVEWGYAKHPSRDLGEGVKTLGRTENTLRSINRNIEEQPESGEDDTSQPDTVGGEQVPGDTKSRFSDGDLDEVL